MRASRMNAKGMVKVVAMALMVAMAFGLANPRAAMSDIDKANDDNYVTIFTTSGKIVVLLFPEEAPITVANFKKLVKKGFYDKMAFHHVIKMMVAMVGSPKADGKDIGYNIIFEPTQRKAVLGAVGMHRANEKESSGSIFFMLFNRQPWLDGKYTIFGQIMDGMSAGDDLLAGDRIEKVVLGKK
jgi:peptidyl-prolyl cis-trans isomerase B (cyclophilin B)